jgi:hypothetical protein
VVGIAAVALLGGGGAAVGLAPGGSTTAPPAGPPPTAAVQPVPTADTGSPAGSSSPSDGASPSGTASPADASSPSDTGSPTGGAGNPSLGAGYVQLYSDADSRFTMPGGNCAGGDFTPSAVSFTAQGPQVTASRNGGNSQQGSGDFWLHCNNVNNNGNTDLEFNTSDQAAEVTSSPDAAACDLAVSRQPLAGSILVTQLKPGVQLCLTANTRSNGTVQGLLVRVTFIAKDATTDDMTWTATAWTLPASNN